MAIEIRLPALGQTADEMEILSWLKQIGDRVSVAEALLVVETKKAKRFNASKKSYKGKARVDCHSNAKRRNHANK